MGDFCGLLPGEPREEGGLVEGFGDGSGPAGSETAVLKRSETLIKDETSADVGNSCTYCVVFYIFLQRSE